MSVDTTTTPVEIVIASSHVDLALSELRQRRNELLADLTPAEGLHFADHLTTLVEPPYAVEAAVNQMRLLKRVLRAGLLPWAAAEFDSRIDEILFADGGAK